MTEKGRGTSLHSTYTARHISSAHGCTPFFWAEFWAWGEKSAHVLVAVPHRCSGATATPLQPHHLRRWHRCKHLSRFNERKKLFVEHPGTSGRGAPVLSVEPQLVHHLKTVHLTLTKPLGNKTHRVVVCTTTIRARWRTKENVTTLHSFKFYAT